MTPELAEKARRAFAEHFGHEPHAISFAPGRVNLIGDHVDYCDGLVLPMPLAHGTAIAWTKNDSGKFRIIAADFDGTKDSFTAGDKPEDAGSWQSYVRGMAALLAAAPDAGLDAAIAGDLPRGAGLSSSASLCTAWGRALVESGLALPLSPANLARTAQKTEHEFAHVSCGIMDQMASGCGEAGHALFLDCRSLEYRNIALPTGWTVLIVPSLVTRELAYGAYNQRRSECEAAAAKIGAASLRDASFAMIEAASLSGNEAKRAAHVVGEIARVEAAASAMEALDIARFGQLLNESHASLRDLFEVSHPEVDRLAAILQRTIGTAGGARMTGGGFGGAVAALCHESRVGEIRAAIAQNYSVEAAEKTIIIETTSPQIEAKIDL